MNQALQIPYRLKIITREEWRETIDLDEQPEGETYYEDGKENSTAGKEGETSGQPAGSGENESGKTKSN